MSETPLLAWVGIDDGERQRRMEFLGITDDDRARLEELAPFAESIADDAVERLYQHMLSFEETAAFLADAALAARFKEIQREYFVGMTRGVYDAGYFESRLRIGLNHAKTRVALQWYLGGCLAQLHFVQARLFETFAAEPEKLLGYLETFSKILTLDIGLAADAYITGGFVERSLAEAHEREADHARQALVARWRDEARKEELLSMVVHDIRSPVTAMMATARVGLRRYRKTDEPPGKQFSLIEESGSNVLQIIDDMIAVSRLSHDDMPVRLEAFDVAEIVSGCVEELRSFAHQTGQSVAMEGAHSVPARTLDRVLVRRIVSNLLVNAFRHTPAGTHVTVSSDARDGICIIRVADDGPGIPRSIRDRLFVSASERGRRGPGAYVDSGLGLPFCRMACERLGGHIHLEATGRRGSSFVVELPAG